MGIIQRCSYFTVTKYILTYLSISADIYSLWSDRVGLPDMDALFILI